MQQLLVYGVALFVTVAVFARIVIEIAQSKKAGIKQSVKIQVRK